jgi:peptide subunit release factor 1 (eRF1)
MSTPRPTLELVLSRLHAIRSDAPRVLTCYVRLDEPARHGGRFLFEVKGRVQALHHWLETAGLSHAVREGVEADLAELVEWLEQPKHLPHAPGLALFLCGELGLFDVIPLGRVHRTRVDLDRTPLLQELVGAQETLGRYLGVLLDRRHARFFDVGSLDTLELSCLAPIGRRGGKFVADRADAPGWGEGSYHNRVEDEKHRHYARIAQEIARHASAVAFRGIALLGPAEHTHAVRPFLPRVFADLVMGESRLNPTSATADEVHAAVWAQQQDQERAVEASLVAAMEDGVTTGWAVNGPRETLSSLARGQIRVLLVPADQRGAGFRCPDTGRLVVSRAGCRGEGEPIPVPNLVDRAIDDALESGAEVAVIDDPAQAERIDGLAGVLRFRLRAAEPPAERLRQGHARPRMVALEP